MVKWIRLVLPLLIFGLMTAVMPLAWAETPQVVSVSAGFDYSHAVLDNGTLWAWGSNGRGQLGIGSEIDQPLPVMVPLDRVKAVAAGHNFTLALRDDGTVWSWGDNTYGQLGDGTNVTRMVPVRVHGLSGVKAVAACFYFAMALKEDGTVWAWGPGKSWNDINYEPERVDIADVTAISCGGLGHLCVALRADGSIRTWEVGHSGDIASVPISNVTAISCSGNGASALKDDGTVWSWGDNTYAQLGAVTARFDQTTPVRTDRLENVALITRGGASFAVTQDGRTFVWGGGLGAGMQGNGERFHEIIEAPEPVPGLAGLKAISVGYRHCLAIRDDGTVLAWGANDYGQLGNGLNASTYDFVAVDYYPDGTDYRYSPDPYICGEPFPVPIVVGGPPATTNKTVLMPGRSAYDLAAVPDGTPHPASVSLSAEGGWAVALGEPAQYITQDQNGDIYVFSGNDIRCISRDGEGKWSLAVPDGWTVCRNRERVNTFDSGGGEYVVGTGLRPVYALADGMLYLYVVPDADYTIYPGWHDVYTGAASDGMTWAIIAISPEGRIAWTHPLDTFPKKFDDTFVGASGGRVYVFHGYAETVLDRNGSVLFEIDDVAVPAGADEYGNIYVAEAMDIQNTAGRIDGGEFAEFRLPGRVVTAYGPDGTLLWRTDVGEYISWNYVQEELRQEYGTTPVYRDGTLYVPVRSGVVALEANGSIKWSQTLESGRYRLFPVMPLDSHGNVYIENQYYSDPDATHEIYVISNDGKDISPPRRYWINAYDLGTVARDGIVYDVSWRADADDPNPLCPTNLSNLIAYTIRAYDIVNDTVLWAYTIPTDHKRSVVLDDESFSDIFGGKMADWLFRNYAMQSREVIDGTSPGNRTDYRIAMYLDSDSLYVIAHEANYEIPVVFGKSQCVYASGLYVIDTNGELAYGKPLDGKVTAATVGNGTVFFTTGGGGLSAVIIGAAAVGLALLGAIAIAAKFLLFGSVTRARTRLDKNENRNLVLAYVREHPGSTLYDVSRGMRMNRGTIRYHLFILGVNHKIATFNDGKFVRYFPNSNFYSPEEQQLIALMRRDATGRILQALRDNPGLTNADLSKKVGLPHSAINRYLNELMDKSIAEKAIGPDGRCGYVIRDGPASKIAGFGRLF